MDGNKRVSMDDIAKALNISKNAVSLALRGKSGVSEQLRARVIETAQRMKYGDFTSSTGVRYIVAILPRRLELRDEDSFTQQVCFSMEAYAHSCGYQLIITSLSEQEESTGTLPSLLDSLPCAGVMTLGSLSLAYCQRIAGLGLRYIMVDQCYDELAVTSVTGANATGAYLLTKHLIDQGHRIIAYLGDKLTTAGPRARWEGYCRAMDEYYASLSTAACQLDWTVGRSDGSQSLRKALDAVGKMPTAIVCGYDNAAAIVARNLEELGHSVPADISIVGFNDMQPVDASPPHWTTYRVKKEALARTAMELFMREEDVALVNVTILGELTRGGSVRALGRSGSLEQGDRRSLTGA